MGGDVMVKKATLEERRCVTGEEERRKKIEGIGL
jgi:hypothetical protein